MFSLQFFHVFHVFHLFIPIPQPGSGQAVSRSALAQLSPGQAEPRVFRILIFDMYMHVCIYVYMYISYIYILMYNVFVYVCIFCVIMYDILHSIYI